LFALKALLDLQALNSNNVRGGTCLTEAGGAKKIGCRVLGISRFTSESPGKPIDDCVIEIGGPLGRGFGWETRGRFSMSEELVQRTTFVIPR
jgi:hypothetical protein